MTSEKAFGLQSTLRERKRSDGRTWCAKESLRSSQGILSDDSALRSELALVRADWRVGEVLKLILQALRSKRVSQLLVSSPLHI